MPVTTVTEPLVDAKDEARQAEVRTDIAQALLAIERTMKDQLMAYTRVSYWTMGVVVGMGGLVIAVLK